MLQQTRVETVLPYFERFLRTFPTIKVLAKASLQSVLRVWAGLGYYARARHLHAAAKIICNDLGGKIPPTKKDLLLLPGLGPYIAGAVASIAFNEPAAALDGNVRRVLSRLLDGQGISERKKLEGFLEDLIPLGRASDFNQALMDLGALICIPGQPRCPQCPVKKFCSWRGVENQREKRELKRIRKEVWAIALVEQDGRFFLHRKEGRGLLAGLWQFPTVVLNGKGMSNESETIEIKGEQKEASREKEPLKKALKENFGLRVKIKSLLPNKEHQFTHLNVTMKPFLCSLLKMLPCDRVPKDVRWVKPSNLSRYPISRAMDKIASLILNPPVRNH
jgi:A/G-specific adenine glycosylase